MTLPPGSHLDVHAVVVKLGEGGMGEVGAIGSLRATLCGSGAKVRVSPQRRKPTAMAVRGRELFYIALDGRMFGVPIDGTGVTFESRAPAMPFEAPIPAVVPQMTQ